MPQWIALLAMGLIIGALTACAPSGISTTEEAGAAPLRGVAALAPAFRDYRLETRRPGGEACISQDGPLRYVESLEYVSGPLVTFGLDGENCIGEIRVEYAAGSQFEHIVSFVTQQLGMPDGEDQAHCPTLGEAVHSVFWQQPEGRLEVVEAGRMDRSVLVLRSAGTAFSYERLCAGGVTRG